MGNKKGHRTLNVISVNPDSLNKTALTNILAAMTKRQIHIAAIQETHIQRDQDYYIGHYRIISTKAEKRENDQGNVTYVGGVSTILDITLADKVKTINRITQRITYVTLDTKNNPIPVTILNTYAPHSGYTIIEKGKYWEEVKKTYKNISKHHLTIWATDNNGQLGRPKTTTKSRVENIIGPHTHYTPLVKKGTE